MFEKMEYGKSGRTEGIIGEMVLSDTRKVEQICEKTYLFFIENVTSIYWETVSNVNKLRIMP